MDKIAKMHTKCREVIMAKKQNYGNESISALKGADRVRKRPAVIFGSDGLDGPAGGRHH